MPSRDSALTPAHQPGPAGAFPVMLSASVPEEVAGTPRAQRVYVLVSAIVEALFDAGAELVFGGHPTITPLVHRLAKDRRAPMPAIALYQLERFRTQAPPESADAQVFARVHWVGDRSADIVTDLAELRDQMARRARAAIFVGGKTAGCEGGKPGIRDELERFRAMHEDAPVYLVGSAGGETARLIEDAGADDWEHNGLQGEARHVLHASVDPQIVATLIARDLQRTLGAGGEA